jgi:SAM-dependent methyltransferase
MKDPDLKTTFNKDAERYHNYRPHYPQALFDKLIHDTNLTPSSRLLEIGPGTGQATESMAKYGCDITAIELGSDLADKARSVLKKYQNVKVLTGAYEDTELPSSYFDLIYSATAFHWIQPEVRFKKSAELLKPGGYLAVIYSEHVSDEKGDKFFFASKPIYEKYTSEDSPVNTNESFSLPKIDQLKPRPPIDSSLFEFESFTVFPVTITYSAYEYAELLNTYSPTIALPPDRREKFLVAIENLINNEFDGSTARHFAMTLAIAKKKDSVDTKSSFEMI